MTPFDRNLRCRQLHQTGGVGVGRRGIVGEGNERTAEAHTSCAGVGEVELVGRSGQRSLAQRGAGAEQRND